MHGSISRCVGKVISGVCDLVYLSVCASVCVHTLKGKRLELSIPNLVDIGLYSANTIRDHTVLYVPCTADDISAFITAN